MLGGRSRRNVSLIHAVGAWTAWKSARMENSQKRYCVHRTRVLIPFSPARSIVRVVVGSFRMLGRQVRMEALPVFGKYCMVASCWSAE